MSKSERWREEPRPGATWALAVFVSCAGWGSPDMAIASLESGGKAAIERQDGVCWLIGPGGGRFFSLGVCCVDRGAPREKYDPENPGYAAWQHYPDPARWADAALRRLRSWGFTTIGGWSDFESLRRAGDAPVWFTPVLHIGSTAGAPWWDMWDPKNVERMERVARDQILPLRDDPRLLGYYSDNEIGWWDGTLLRMTLDQAPASGQRRRLIDLLRETYRDDWSLLLAEFEAEGAGDFEALGRGGTLYLRPGGDGIRVARRFLALAAERYYALMREIISRYHPRALFLGDRYQSFYYPEVACAAAPHVDAVSTNLNASWSDGTFPRYFLDTLHALTGRPVLVGEFYAAARENRSGNRNSRGIFPVVATQAERAAVFRTTIEALAQLPYVIGADWFQYYDEPTRGRDDGEDFNFGLVDIHDRPYEEIAAAAASLDLAGVRGRPSSARPDASAGIPPAPPDPLGRMEPTLALKHWDRERGFVRPVSEFPLADLYACWDGKAIYLGLLAQDVIDDGAYRARRVPERDRAEWTVSIPGAPRPVRSRIGAGLEPRASDPSVRIVQLSGVKLTTRCVAAMELPAAAFGRDRFRGGDAIEFASTFLSHGRAYRVAWKGRFILREGR